MKMTILSTAAYDNWKPTSQSQYGLINKRNNADKASVLSVDDFLSKESPNTIQVNMTAERRTEGWPPDSKLNNHRPARMRTGLNQFNFFPFCNGLKSQVSNQ